LVLLNFVIAKLVMTIKATQDNLAAGYEAIEQHKGAIFRRE
jgi:hypothetical protein